MSINLSKQYLVLKPGLSPDLNAPHRPASSLLAEVQSHIGSHQLDLLPIRAEIGLWLDGNRWQSLNPQLNLWATALLGVQSETHSPDVLINTVVVTGLSTQHLPRVLNEEQSELINQAFKLDPKILLASVRKQLIQQYGHRATTILTSYPDPKRTAKPFGAAASAAIAPHVQAQTISQPHSPWAPPMDS